ncbi:MAG: insulinase family protein, partial [Chloroflexi bacterium]|nr:insulinase family protein [Chloroflexota bacterium]
VDAAHGFFQPLYTPSSASLSIAGDFELGEARELVERYFGSLQPGPNLARANRTDSPLQGHVQLSLYDRVLVPRLYLEWPTVPRFHADEPALSALADILANGRSSRLHQSLVYERRIAQSVSAYHHGAEIAGEFGIEITAAEGHTITEIEDVLLSELDLIRRQPPSASELSRAKNRLEWGSVRQMASIGGFGGRANRLNSFNVFAGDPDVANRDLERFLAVEPDDVSRAATTYLASRQVRLVVLPERSLTQKGPDIDRSVQPPPAPLRRFAPSAPLRHRLSNGLQLLVVEKRAVPMIAFSLILKAGAATDPIGLPGLAAFTADMLEEGTASRSSMQIAGEFEFMGSHLTSSAAREHTTVGTATLTREFPKALELVSDLVRNPTFPEDELARLGNERRTSVRRLRDNPAAIANQLTPALLYGRQSAYGHPLDGAEGLYETVRRDDVMDHFRTNFGPQSATLAVVGDISLEEAVELAERYFGGWNEAGPVTADTAEAPVDGAPDGTSLYLHDKPGAAQSVIQVGLVGVPRSHQDYFALTVLNHLFGGQFTSRLNMNLRQDKGYSYGYRSWIEWHRQSSLLMAGGSVQTDVTREAVQETLKEFHEIGGGRPVTEVEFQTAKASLLRQFPSSFENSWQVLEELVPLVSFDLPDDYYRTFPADIEAVSLEDVRRVAQERIDNNRLMLLVVGDRDVVEPGLREIGLPMSLIDHEGREI